MPFFLLISILSIREQLRHFLYKIPFSLYSYIIMGIAYSIGAFFIFSIVRLCILHQEEINRRKELNDNEILDADFIC